MDKLSFNLIGPDKTVVFS